jgi:hypothetical protein
LKREVRRFVVRRFPYVVLIANIDGERRVIAVMHGHQEPRSWRGRVRGDCAPVRAFPLAMAAQRS